MYAQIQQQTLSSYELQYRLLMDSFIPDKLALDVNGIRWFRNNLITACYLSKEDIIEQFEVGVSFERIRKILKKSLTESRINNLITRWKYEHQRND